MPPSLFKIPPATLAKTDGTDYFYKVYQSTVFKVKNCNLFYVKKFLFCHSLDFDLYPLNKNVPVPDLEYWLAGNNSTYRTVS